MTTVLSQAHVYYGKSLFGKVSEFKLPDIEFNTVSIKDVSGLGEKDLPTGIKQLKTTLSVDGYDKDVIKNTSNPFSEKNIIVYGNLREFNGQNLQEERPVKATMRAGSSKVTLGTIKGQENTSCEIELNVSAFKLEDNGEKLLHIDFDNHIWIVNGVDLLEKARTNLGLN